MTKNKDTAAKRTVSMRAEVPIESWQALQNGEAVCNNGLRSLKGNFMPKQPDLYPMDERSEELKDEVVEGLAKIALAAAAGYVHMTVLPALKRFNDEHVYPLVVEKWEAWCEKKRMKAEQKKAAALPKAPEASSAEGKGECKIISFEDMRKRA